MAWDVSEGGGEDGVFGWVEGGRRFVLVGVVGPATLPNEAQSKMRWVSQDCVQWPYCYHRSSSNLLPALPELLNVGEEMF